MVKWERNKEIMKHHRECKLDSMGKNGVDHELTLCNFISALVGKIMGTLSLVRLRPVPNIRCRGFDSYERIEVNDNAGNNQRATCQEKSNECQGVDPEERTDLDDQTQTN
jgi:hypothetical protein